MLEDNLKEFAPRRNELFPLKSTEELKLMRGMNNPRKEPTGHYTGRCRYCSSGNLWDDNLTYDCNDCGAIYFFS